MEGGGQGRGAEGGGHASEYEGSGWPAPPSRAERAPCTARRHGASRCARLAHASARKRRCGRGAPSPAASATAWLSQRDPAPATPTRRRSATTTSSHSAPSGRRYAATCVDTYFRVRWSGVERTAGSAQGPRRGREQNTDPRLRTFSRPHVHPSRARCASPGPSPPAGDLEIGRLEGAGGSRPSRGPPRRPRRLAPRGREQAKIGTWGADYLL